MSERKMPAAWRYGVWILIAAVVVMAGAASIAAIRGNAARHYQYATDLARLLHESGSDFDSVTDEGGGVVAIETSLYPKPENQTYAADLCAVVTFNVIAGLEDARVRASDGSTLLVCTLP